MVVLVSACMFLTLSITSFLLYTFRPMAPSLPGGPWTNILAVETGVEALQAAPPQFREAIARRISSNEVIFTVSQTPPCVVVPTDHITAFLQRMLVFRGNLGTHALHAKSCAPREGGTPISYLFLPRDNISIQLYNTSNHHLGRMMRFGRMMRWTMPLTLSLTFLLTITLSLTFWSIWHISRPLRNIAVQADAFSYDIAPEPLPEHGPTEVRQLTHAFNRMQARIAASAEERTRMLIAIGHDLRTPLTRLFMRLELGGEEASPSAMKHDLTLMKKMLNGALHFLREQTDAEKAEAIDLASLLESLCHEFGVVGHTIHYVGPPQLIGFYQTTALERALSNLIENGLKYGTEVHVSLRKEGQRALIDISDNGPGIPVNLLASARLPFYRLDPARASDGGLGLGLSIADAIITRHNGQLVLSNIAPHGLCAHIALPLGTLGF
ncbi:two-component sensor histidine kinase [Acetobacter orleanensis]|nr:two-component sensor histidine kinase [Acetobacter orleanensis]